MKTAEELLNEITEAVMTANVVIQHIRLVGTDQNPLGFRDRLGLASEKLAAWQNRKKEKGPN